MSFSINRVRPDEDPVATDDIRTLHELTFLDAAPQPDLSKGHWWLVRDTETSKLVAFAGIIPSSLDPQTIGYFNRVGVLPVARGHRLQRRLMTVIERKARKNGWLRIVSDTTDNPPSANAMIGAGYRIFEPAVRWAFPHSIYWNKDLVR